MRAHAVVTALLLLTRVIPASAQELSAETLQAINAASRARVRLADDGLAPARGNRPRRLLGR